MKERQECRCPSPTGDAATTFMNDLYKRLKKVGFDPDFVREAVLPDWWDDSVADVPFNRALAETAVSGHLGYPIRLLRDRDADLPIPDTVGVCFKRNTKVDARKVAPGLQVVRRVAELVTGTLPKLLPFRGGQSVAVLRKWILDRHKAVDLTAILDACWAHGVPVIGVPHLPKKSVRFDGVAMFCGKRPVIVLASAKDGPPWLAFHLAHELGHIMHGHVKPGEALFVDANLKSGVNDYTEVEADEFGLELLTGRPGGLEFRPSRLKAHELGLAAADFTENIQPTVAAGTVVLSYCKSATFWGVAQGALEALNQHAGGRALVAKSLAKHIDFDALTEGAERFIEATCCLRTSCPTDERRTAACG
jgi:hypothetical protein